MRMKYQELMPLKLRKRSATLGNDRQLSFVNILQAMCDFHVVFIVQVFEII